MTTGVAFREGKWGDVEDPVFQGFWRAGIDMFTGEHLSERTNLVTGTGVMDVVVCPKGDQILFTVFGGFFGPGANPDVYGVQPEGGEGCGEKKKK